MREPTHSTIGQASARALLRYAVAALLLGSGLTLLLTWLAPLAGLHFFGPVAFLAVGLLGWLLLARGRVELAALSLGYGVCLVASGMAAFTGGIHAPVMVIFPVLILTYGWLSSAAAAIRLTVLISALTVGLWAGEWLRVLPTMAPAPTSFHVVHVLIIYALSVAFSAFIMRAYQRRVRELNTVSEELAGHTRLLKQNTDLLERAQSVANVGSWVSDIVADEITPSPQGCRILGMAIGAHSSYAAYMARVHEDDRARVARIWQTARKSGLFEDEHRVMVKGQVRWVRQRAELAFAANGTPLSALGIVQDITCQKKTELALKASEERYRTLIEWSPEAILVHQRTHIMYANPAALALFGAPNMQSLLSKRTTDLIHPDDLGQQQARMNSIEKGEPLPPSTEARFLKLDGSTIDVEVQGTAIEFDGEPAVHVSIRDITQRKRLENDIRQLAFYDSLTSLPNRRLLDDRLRQVLSANRRSGHFGALMFLDLDNFKPLNDQHGHAVGDLLLVQAAQRLKSCTRAMDTVARFGGDEFVVLLTELDTDWQKARRYAETVARKIKAAMAMPYTLPVQDPNQATGQIEHRCTASIGVVVFNSSQAQASELTRWADTAMYQAKNDGRNRICFSEHSADEVVNHYFFDSSLPFSDEG
ncbi:diguanylate cyclase [Rhodoferax sp. 4810]|nr:diguanylate cyclase [Rhodoferax jenense]